MSSKTVTWTSCINLSCSSCLSSSESNVVLCLDSSLVENAEGEKGFIDARISSKKRLSRASTSCGCAECDCGTGRPYRYSLVYDPDLLASPDDGIISEDILGVLCKGCLLDYINFKGNRAKVLQAQILYNDRDILADPDGTTYDLDLDLVNPSSDRSCAVTLNWGWDMVVGTVDNFSIVRVAANLLLDGVAVTGFDDSAREGSVDHNQDGVPWQIEFAGPGGSHNIILAPGVTKTATLRFTKSSGSPQPTEGFSIRHAFLNAFGVVF